MAQLDKYIQHLLRFDARSLTITSNGPVVARLASGVDKASTQTVEHALLVAAVNESAPSSALNDIRASRPARFVYPPDGAQVMVEVTPTPGAWKVVLTPQPSARERTSSDRVVTVSRPPSVRPRPSAGEGERGGRSSARPDRPSGSVERVSIPAAPVAVPVDRPPLRPSSPAVTVVAPSAPPPQPQRPASMAPAQSLPAAQSVPPSPAPSPPPAAQWSPGRAAQAVDDVPLDSAGIDRLLRGMTKMGASDLHLATGRAPLVRLHGEIKPLVGEHPPLTAESLRALILPTMKPATRQEYADKKDADFAYEIPEVARFRGNAFVDRRGPAAVYRRIPVEIVPAEQLGLSRHVLDLCNLSKGLVLVTGPTGSGKSTTLAAMIDRINSNRSDHIITIEDPIEFVHKNRRCLINQREVRVHTEGFRALRAALREDPDVVLVGEMRDLETVSIAIETAETGHLVFGTLHTRTAPSTIDRIIDQFPAERQAQIRTMLSESLKGVIAQTLCKKIGGGRVAAYEVLIATPAVANLIREGKTFQLLGVMQTGREKGMVTLHDALCELVKQGKIDVREAWAKALSKVEMRQVLQHAGIALPPDLARKE
ncbi:MAG: PilT/PilU family type 4a pilus ATPase [Polyangiales bacterium]